MEKKAYISIYQVFAILLASRINYATAYQAVLQTGNYIQDLLLSLPVNFITNFIVAIPTLILLKRNPGHDLVECACNIVGRPIGSMIAIIYFFFFIACATLISGNFENTFVTVAIPDVSHYLTGVFLIVVCIYGAIKGIESIARVTSVGVVIYIITTIIIFLTDLSRVDLNFLKPILYTGPTYMIAGSIMNYNLSFQIVLLAFLASFTRTGCKLTKTYSIWNIVSLVIVALLEFFVVTVAGPYGAQQIYPLETLATLSKISVFEHLEVLYIAPSILNDIIIVSVNIYFAVTCLQKIGLNKYRKILALVCGIILFFLAPYLAENFYIVQAVVCSKWLSAVITVFTFVIPLIILIIDIVKKKVMQDEQRIQNTQNSQAQ